MGIIEFGKKVLRFIRKRINRHYNKLYQKYLLNHPRKYADILYHETFGEYIDWDNPKDLNEKINWLAFNTDTTEWSNLADKYLVHEYLKKKGLGALLTPIYGKWDNVDEIDISNLPNKFVLKTNCGSGDVLIIKDKSKVNISEIKQYFEQVLSYRFGKDSAEPHYLRIKPCVFAEHLLEGEIVDYKIWCFNGEPYCVLTVSNRNYETHAMDLNVFDLDWNRHNEWLPEEYRNEIIVPKPKYLKEMLRYAKVLSSGFPQVRIDLYEKDNAVFFGEMTFTSACGRMTYFSKEALLDMGKQIKL